jgi:hypothetical protein
LVCGANIENKHIREFVDRLLFLIVKTIMSIGDRLVACVLSAIFGAVYGIFLALIFAWIGDGTFDKHIVIYAALVFGGLGLVLGNVAADIIGCLLHFWFGVADGWFGSGSYSPPHDTPDLLKALFIIGVGTGIVLYWVRP